MNSDDHLADGFTELIEASQSGRMIVPFLAAGFSASSGYPLIEQLTQYLLKVKFYIKHGVSEDILGSQLSGTSDPTRPRRGLSRNLRDFGWPDPNQLTLDLYNYAEHVSSTSRRPSRGSQRRSNWIDQHVAHFLSDKHGLFTNYLNATRGSRKWGLRRWRIQSAIQAMLLEDIYLTDDNVARDLLAQLVTLTYQPRADWSRLLMELTEGNLGLVDALFSRLGARYSPGPSHILMAHIVKRLRISLILTINFDPFLESCLLNEGLRPRIFDVGRDALPPDETVIQQGLSIVKLHGGAYGFRVGERLDYALDEATRTVIQSYIPADALLLVTGFSGHERRMMQLLEHLVSHTSPHLPEHRARVVWTHKEAPTGLAPPLEDFRNSIGRESPLLRTQPIFDAGDFLLEWYQRATGALPKTPTRYPALPRRIVPTVSTGPANTPTAESITARPSKGGPFHLFVRDSVLASATPQLVRDDMRHEPSIEMSHYVSSPAHRTYDVIWVDLEDHHTVSGVVTEIVDKMRVFDPDLPPLILPLDGPIDILKEPLHAVGADKYAQLAEYLDKPVRYLTRALRRGRYIIAFDSFEGFGRLHTSHHGLPATSSAGRGPSRIALSRRKVDQQRGRLRYRIFELHCFLHRLMALSHLSDDKERAQIDWLCCVSCDEPSPRHYPGFTDSDSLLYDVRWLLQKFAQNDLWWNIATKGAAQATYPHILHPLTRAPRRRSSPVPQHPAPDMTRLAALVSALEHIALPAAAGSAHSESAAEKNADALRDYCSGAENTAGAIIGQCLKAHGERPLNISGLDGAYVLCAVFRRPRSYAALQAVWDDFGTPAAFSTVSAASHGTLDSCLFALSQPPLAVVRPMMGGFYWIPHHLHQWTYKVLTERVHWKNISAFTTKRDVVDPGDARGVLERLTFLILVHSRAAYFYYTHAFARSRDVNAFFEYLYHRTSSLRYAKDLSAYVSALRDEEICLVGAIADKLIARISKYEGVPLSGGAASLRREELRDRIDAVRLKLLRGFINAWLRERDVVFPAASADTWIAWLEQLEQDCEAIVAGSTDVATPLAAPVRPLWRDGHNIELAESGMSLHLLLLDSRARLLRERRAWRHCLKCRIDAIIHLIARVARLPAEIVKVRSVVAEDGVGDKIDERRWRAFLARLEKSRERLEVSRFSAAAANRYWRDTAALFVKERVGATAARRALAEADGAAVTLNWKSVITKIERLGSAVERSGYSGESLEEFWKCILDEVIGTKEGETVLRAQLATLSQGSGAHVPWLRMLCDTIIDMAACVRHVRDGDGGDVAWKLLTSIGPHVFNTLRELGNQEVKGRHGEGARSVTMIVAGLERDLAYQRLRFAVECQPLWDRPLVNYRGSDDRTTADKEARDERVKMVEGLLKSIQSELCAVKGVTPTGVRDFFRRLCQLHTLAARCFAVLGRCREGIAAVDQAEGAIRDLATSERGLVINVHICRADLLMKDADMFFLRPDGARGAAGGHVTPARARLRDAGAVLAGAEQLVKHSRASIGQSLQLYARCAQLEIEELLLLLVELEWDKPTRWRGDDMRFLSELWMRARRGLESIRGAWDCSLSPLQGRRGVDDAQIERDRRQWVGMWAQLMVYSNVALMDYATVQAAGLPPIVEEKQGDSILERAHRLRKANADVARRQATFTDTAAFNDRWEVLNRSAGLGRFVEPDQRRLYEELIAVLTHISRDCSAPLPGMIAIKGDLTSRERAIKFTAELFSSNGVGGIKDWPRRFVASLDRRGRLRQSR